MRPPTPSSLTRCRKQPRGFSPSSPTTASRSSRLLVDLSERGNSSKLADFSETADSLKAGDCSEHVTAEPSGSVVAVCGSHAVLRAERKSNGAVPLLQVKRSELCELGMPKAREPHLIRFALPIRKGKRSTGCPSSNAIDMCGTVWGFSREVPLR